MTFAPNHSTAITDFLSRALAGGALAVSDLEVKARAAGLLGERQPIQHAKAFKKAKKALGVRSVRNGFGSGGKWAWLMPPQAAQIEIGSVANSHPDTKEQQSIGETKLPETRPFESESCGIVQQWTRAFSASTTCDPLLPCRICAGNYFWEIATAS
jgi:hypothetical protein